jgi:hypothetical protein
MSRIVDQARLDANWRAIIAELDAPRASRMERVLRRAHVPGHVTRLVAATPALRRAWYLSIAIAVVVGLGAAQPDDRSSLFALLVLAPALPVLGVALAYGPAADPMYEAQLATPTRGLRLVAMRAVTVLGVSVLAVAAPALLAPATRGVAFLWLLPALALTSASLALMTWLPPRRSASIVAAVWFGVVVLAQVASTADLAAFGAAGQLVAVIVAVAGAAVAFGRRDVFDRMDVIA